MFENDVSDFLILQRYKIDYNANEIAMSLNVGSINQLMFEAGVNATTARDGSNGKYRALLLKREFVYRLLQLILCRDVNISIVLQSSIRISRNAGGFKATCAYGIMLIE